jgi:hypothetical protein
MPTIRRHLPGIDKSRCEECADRAEVVIEEYPNPQHHRSLCRDCATVALQEHPGLLASVVIVLILKGGRPELADCKVFH